MAGFNRVTLLGNLTRDAELRYAPSGIAVMTFTIAVNEKKGKNEENQQEENTLFIDAVAFGKLAEAVYEYMKKGKQILLEGKLRYRTWEDANGGKHSKHEIIINDFLLLSSPSQKNKKPCNEEKQLLENGGE